MDADFSETYPELFEHLTATCYDGDPNQGRAVSTLLVFAQDGVWKGCLRDRQEACCCWAAAPSVTGLFEVLEGLLKDDTAVWRADRLSGATEAVRKPKAKSS